MTDTALRGAHFPSSPTRGDGIYVMPVANDQRSDAAMRYLFGALIDVVSDIASPNANILALSRA